MLSETNNNIIERAFDLFTNHFQTGLHWTRETLILPFTDKSKNIIYIICEVFPWKGQ